MEAMRTGPRTDFPCLVFSSWIPVYEQTFSLRWHRIVLLVCNFFHKGQEKSGTPKSQCFHSLACLLAPFLSDFSCELPTGLGFGDQSLCCHSITNLLCDLKRSLTSPGLICISKGDPEADLIPGPL